MAVVKVKVDRRKESKDEYLKNTKEVKIVEKPCNLLFIAKHKGFKGSFELIPVKTNLRFIVSRIFV